MTLILRQQGVEAHGKLDELQSAGEQAWEDLESNAEKAFADLEADIERASSHFRSASLHKAIAVLQCHEDRSMSFEMTEHAQNKLIEVARTGS